MLKSYLQFAFLFQRWAIAFRNEGFNVKVNTNNGLERQNQVFKSNYLLGHKSKSLSAMLTVLIEQYLPDNYNRYLVNKSKQFLLFLFSKIWIVDVLTLLDKTFWGLEKS